MIYGLMEGTYSFDVKKKTMTFDGQSFKVDSSLIMDVTVLDRTDSVINELIGLLQENNRRDICESESFQRCLSF